MPGSISRANDIKTPFNGWIPVIQNLPPRQVDVLVWFDAGLPDGGWVETACLDRHDRWRLTGGDSTHTPMYWMPLPPPPPGAPCA
ncbi:MAG: hypothetical protein COX57_06800 [Alphaproteobacteria bacterium CG_4_10_14_0_2_um_filter_63_37]|nr:MAG: hypothetical protein AUJ55_06750 [Proteobacteria bacterium CG1_02_64_396]PJA24707.1 MAG: hypothetical protein COX57_06800 [Alphaproteobacteria bacterium CG_4_10_14_0_2_um_filter_63_37]